MDINIVSADAQVVAAAVCAELKLESNDFVQVREDAEHYYIDIGRSDEIQQIYQKVYDNIQALEDRYSVLLRSILTQLKAGNMPNVDLSSFRSSPAMITGTPLKSKALPGKRPVPKSSSINKVIATEESIIVTGPPIAESSTRASNTIIRTRSQTRLADSAFKDAANKTLLQPVEPKPGAKVTRAARKAQQAQISSQNTTPSKRTRGNRACSASPVASGTPPMTALRRKELEKNRQERLMMSEEKRKKADETKRALLDSRAQQLKEDREKRMEKVQENKQLLEQQGHERLVRPMTKRNAERRAKLAAIELAEKVKTKPSGRAAKKAIPVAVPAAKATAAQDPVNDSKGDSKSKATGKKAVGNKKMAAQSEPMDVDATPLSSSAGLSPIAKPSTSGQPAGINSRINETFTTAAHMQAGPSLAPAHSTFVAGAPANQQENVNFAMLANLPPSTPKATTSGALAKSYFTPTTYQMTPPPRQATYDDNYDISKYIDPDEEDGQAAQDQVAHGKKIPKWAQGNNFVKLFHTQFGLPAEELAAKVKKIFPKPVLPVPLEDMGLPVREKYAVRSSSINWKQAKLIQKVVTKIDKM